MRLINVDDLEDMEMETCDTDDSIVIKERVAGRNHIRQIVKDAPTIDAAPIVHAYWIEEGDGYQICSNCGEEHCWADYRATYCDVCGAKMDGKPPVDSKKM